MSRADGPEEAGVHSLLALLLLAAPLLGESLVPAVVVASMGASASLLPSMPLAAPSSGASVVPAVVVSSMGLTPLVLSCVRRRLSR
eukprot:865564-Alexandrium_andersonii.AAC.1